jgi:hypothetical protein
MVAHKLKKGGSLYSMRFVLSALAGSALRIQGRRNALPGRHASLRVWGVDVMRQYALQRKRRLEAYYKEYQRRTRWEMPGECGTVNIPPDPTRPGTLLQTVLCCYLSCDAINFLAQACAVSWLGI